VELQSFRSKVIQLFKRYQSHKNPHSWELYRGAQRNLRKEVRKVSKNAWGTSCYSINHLPRSDRLQTALSRDPKIKLGSLVAPSGGHTWSEGENFQLLLTTHFHNSGVTQEVVAPAAALLARRLDCRLATRVVTSKRVEWALGGQSIKKPKFFVFILLLHTKLNQTCLLQTIPLHS